MSLITCSACGRSISSEAAACPQCGHPNRAPAREPESQHYPPPSPPSGGVGQGIGMGFGIAIGLIVTLVVLSILCSGLGNQRRRGEVPSPSQPSYAVSTGASVGHSAQ